MLAQCLPKLYSPLCFLARDHVAHGVFAAVRDRDHVVVRFWVVEGYGPELHNEKVRGGFGHDVRSGPPLPFSFLPAITSGWRV